VGLKEVTCNACGRKINDIEFPPSDRWELADGSVRVVCSNCNHIEVAVEESDEESE